MESAFRQRNSHRADLLNFVPKTAKSGVERFTAGTKPSIFVVGSDRITPFDLKNFSKSPHRPLPASKSPVAKLPAKKHKYLDANILEKLRIKTAGSDFEAKNGSSRHVEVNPRASNQGAASPHLAKSSVVLPSKPNMVSTPISSRPPPIPSKFGMSPVVDGATSNQFESPKQGGVGFNVYSGQRTHLVMTDNKRGSRRVFNFGNQEPENHSTRVKFEYTLGSKADSVRERDLQSLQKMITNTKKLFESMDRKFRFQCGPKLSTKELREQAEIIEGRVLSQGAKILEGLVRRRVAAQFWGVLLNQ